MKFKGSIQLQINRSFDDEKILHNSFLECVFGV